MQIFHDEAEALEEVEVEDMLPLQGTPHADSEADGSDDSDLMSPSDMSDDDSEGD